MCFSVYRLPIGFRFHRIVFYLMLVGAVGMIVTYRNLSNHNSVQETSMTSWNPPGNSYLLDLPNFKYQINNDVCGEDDVFLVIVLHSATDHLHNRNTIRKTWGSPGIPELPVKTIFMLAEPKDLILQRAIEAENQEYRDIVQGNFIDTYKNLTYKHVMALRWVSTYCPQANFVMKMDDDIFVDIYQLSSLIQGSMIPKMNHKFIACYFQTQMPVVRDPASKWYVSKEIYSSNTFDDYCSGWAYITNPNTAGELAEMAQKFPYFWVDDVHITGNVASAAQVRRIRINQYFALETHGLVEWVKNGHHFLWNKIFAPTWSDVDLMKISHNKTRTCHLKKCSCCYVPSTPKPSVPKIIPSPTGKSVIVNLSPLRSKTKFLLRKNILYPSANKRQRARSR